MAKNISWSVNPNSQEFIDSILELNRKHSFLEIHSNELDECPRDCRKVIEVLSNFLESYTESETRRLFAEKRVEELTEGLKETMLLFKEREESFDSLAAINREQEKKVS